MRLFRLLTVPLVVIVDGEKVTTPNEARKIVCTLLLPPINLKQELFDEVRVWNKWRKVSPSNEWLVASKRDGCMDGHGNGAVCEAYRRLMYATINIERFRLPLPADPAETCATPKQGLNPDADTERFHPAKAQSTG